MTYYLISSTVSHDLPSNRDKKKHTFSAWFLLFHHAADIQIVIYGINCTLETQIIYEF